jgi:hypothetical protein
MEKRQVLAYLAGAIDSDGTIGIKKSTYAMRVRGDATQAVYSERVALRQVTPEITTLLRDTFGGSLYVTKPSAKNGRPLYSWAATDRKAFDCLVALLPFLLVKKQQAENAVALRKIKVRSMKAKVKRGRGHVGAAVRPVALTEAMESAYLRAKDLNHVGV